MAIALVASTTVGGSSGGTTAAIDTTGATLLAVSVSWWGANLSILTATLSDSKGNTWITLPSQVSGGAQQMRHQFLYCLTPTVGTGHTFTITAAGSYPAVVVYAFSGTSGYSYQTSVGNGSASTASPLATGSVTPTANNALVLTGYSVNNGLLPAGLTVSTAGFTVTPKEGVGGTNFPGAAAYYVQPTAAAINPTWSWASGTFETAVSTAVFSIASPTEIRLTQDAIELLSQPTPASRVSQIVVEVLGTTVSVAAAEARVTQIVAETLTQDPPSPVRVSQIPLELLGMDQPAARVSQSPLELVEQVAAARVFARVSQAPLEIIYPFDGTCYVPAAPVDLVPGLRYIRRLRRAPHVQQDHRRIAYARFALDLQRGVGRPTGQGADPLVTVRLSRDGGKTWGEPVTMRAGKLGAYTTRVVARRLGQARDAVFEVTVSDPVAWALVQAWIDLEPGTS